MASTNNQIVVEIITKNNELLAKVHQQLEQVGERAQKTADSVGGFTAKLANIGMATDALKNIAGSFEGLFAPLAGIDDAVFGLTHSGIKNIGELQKAINSVQGDTIVSTAAGLEAAGKALDSGFIAQTDGVANIAEATMLIEKAGRLAAITGGEIGDVAQTTAEMMNALGKGAADLPSVMDALSFAAAETNFGLRDMMASIKQIAPVATGAGVGLEELAATYITLGRNGQEMGQIQSSIQMLLNQMQRPTAELQQAMERAGVSMQSLAQDGLAATFQKINTALNETGTTAGEVFGGRMEGTFRRLVENADEVKTELEAINKGATGSLDEVYGAFTQTMAGKTQTLQQSVNSVIESMLSNVKDLAPSLTAVSAIMPAVSGVWGAASAGASGLNTVLGMITKEQNNSILGNVKLIAQATAHKALEMQAYQTKLLHLAAQQQGLKIEATQQMSLTKSVALTLKQNVAYLARNVAQKVANGLQLAFNVLAAANPIGLIVAGATALVGTMVLLYKKCEPFRNFVDSLAEKVKLVYDNIAPVRNVVDYIWERLKAVGSAIYSNLIEPIGKLFGLVDKKTAPLKQPANTGQTGSSSKQQGEPVVQPTADLVKDIDKNTDAINRNSEAKERNKKLAEESLRAEGELWKGLTDTVNKAREATAGVQERIRLYSMTEDERELYEFEKRLEAELNSMNALYASLLKERGSLTESELKKLASMGIDTAGITNEAEVIGQAAELQKQIEALKIQGEKELSDKQAAIERKRAEGSAAVARRAVEKMRAIEDIKINLIPDVPLREFEQAKAVLARDLADAKEAWAGNNEMLQLLQQDHDRKMLALQDEFYRAKGERDRAALADYVAIVQAGFSSNIGDIMAQNADVAGTLGDLQAEEDALRTSYNKRKIDYQELQDGLLEISKRRAEAEKQINRDAFSTAFFGQLSAMAGQFAEQSAAKLQGTLSSLPVLKDQSAGLGADLMAKETQAKRLRDLAEIEQNAGQKAALLAQEAEYQEEIGGLRDAKSKKDEEVAAANKQAWAQAGVSLVSSMGASYAKLKAEGASTQKALAVSALGGLKAQIPIYAAQIVGAAFSINPFLGVASLVALPLLYAGLSKAEAAVGAAKFFTGGIVEARSSAERRRDGVPIWANHGEGIMPNWLMEAGDTREALLWSLRKRRSLAEYYLQDKGYVFERVVEADRRLQEVEFARQVQIVNANLVKMHRMQEAQFALVQQELVGTNNRLERLEHADFNKNINIDANINTDLKGAFVDVEFRRRVASGR